MRGLRWGWRQRDRCLTLLSLWITVDKAGNLYITDTSIDRVREVLVPGLPPTTQAAAPQFSVASGTYASPQIVTISDSTPGASIYVSVNGATPAAVNSEGYSFPIDVAGVVTLKAIAAAPGYLNSTVSSATYTVYFLFAHDHYGGR